MFELDIYDAFYKLLEQVPEGRVTTYGDMAVALGDIIASRAVGEMLSQNRDPARYPCHRVVKSDGSLGGFTHPLGLDEKVRRLKREGIEIENGKIRDFQKIRFNDFITDFPLKKFRNWANSLTIQDSSDIPTCIRAMDVTYIGDMGIGVGVTFGEEILYDLFISKVKSPYIPNYLYLREGRIYESLVRKDCVNVIDGNGMLHRDFRGVATIVGINKGLTTIGIAKSLLEGDVKDKRIFIHGIEVGIIEGKYAISPGNKISLDKAYSILTTDKFFPQTKYPDAIGRRLKNEILSARNSI